MTRSQKMAEILEAAGVRARRVLVLGCYVHVDTFEKYQTACSDILAQAGFGLLSAETGRHMDGFDGFRLVYKLA